MPDKTSNSIQTHDMPMAIVGMGCLFPKADGLDAFWANIKNKVDGIAAIPSTHWRPEDYFDADAKKPDKTYAHRGGFLDPYPFRPGEFGIAPRDLEAIDTAQLLGLVVAKMALDDAGLLAPGVDRRRIATILGVTGTLELVVPLGARLGHPLWRKALRESGVADDVADAVVKRIGDGYVGWQENSFPGLLGNVVAGRIANRLDLGGTNCVVDAACASSLSALHLAALELAAGRADAVLTGGVDTFNDIFMYMCFSKTPALSPSGDARPFSADADGTILGEGLGMFVVKRLADAELAHDRIYAVIRGMGTSSDGTGDAVYAPAARGQEEALRRAYQRAGISPSTIGLVEAHGTGTKVGDAVELTALANVFGKANARRGWCAVGSVKSQIGHTKAAAGAAGLIKAALALSKQVLPPTMKVKEPAASVATGKSAFYVNVEKRPWLSADGHPRRAGVSSFGFGGSNFHCVLEEHASSNVMPDWDGKTQLVAISANDRSEMIRQLAEFDAANWPTLRTLAAKSRERFDPSQNQRLVLVLERDTAAKTLANARRELSNDTPNFEQGFLGNGARAKLGFLFPGQGSQSVGMLRDLACQFPEFREALAEADRAFAAGLVTPADQKLSDAIYPPAVFTAAERNLHADALRDTSVAQPALGAVSLGALQVLRRFGVIPDAAAGHSYGELTALCAAGCYDAPSLFALSQLRGQLMSQGNETDAGAMLAVMAPLQDVESMVAEERVGVVLANRNAPNQAVLSGPTAEIERAARSLTVRKVRHVRLPVAAAFHSPLVANASAPFRAALEPIPFHVAQLPVFANSTSHEYPRDPQAVRDLLATQLARPVDFISQIRNMYESGVRMFVEVGPGQTLTRLVGSILHDREHAAIALDASAGQMPGEYDLAMLLARLAAWGQPLKLAEWDPNPPMHETQKSTLVVPICGANYVHPKPATAAPINPRPLPTAPKAPQLMAEPTEPTPPAVAKTEPRATQEALAAFQRMQEQTANVHRLFLEQQMQAQLTLQALLTGQHHVTRVQPVNPIVQETIVQAPVAPKRHSHPPAVVSSPQPVVVPPNPAIVVPDSGNDLVKTLLEVVAEKTGYPVDMLDLDMGLDADLGIDSIKRVEILSALQERLPETPAVPPDRLGMLQTLRQVIELICSENVPVVKSADTLSQTLLSVVAEKTGYPLEMLDLDMGLDADLGIDSIKRVEILSALQERLPETPAVPPDQLGSLQTLRQVIQLLEAEPEKKNLAMTARV